MWQQLNDQLIGKYRIDDEDPLKYGETRLDFFCVDRDNQLWYMTTTGFKFKAEFFAFVKRAGTVQ